MVIKNPSLEKISPEFGSSIAVKQYSDPNPNLKNPFWHFHPELELVYVKGGSGKRHIGNHISYYKNGGLIFIGSNLPHYGFTDRLTGNDSETVIQLGENFLGEAFFTIPEMEPIRQLFERAKVGITFLGETKLNIGERIEQLPKLNNFDRLLELLQILQSLALTKEYRLLNADGFKLEVEHQDNDRINIIYDYVRENFQGPIRLSEIAAEVALTVPGFCRYFKKISGKTFTKFVNEFRVVHATKLLSEETTSITEICFESGFNNFSHFNKVFKEVTKKSPSAYRKEITQVIS